MHATVYAISFIHARLTTALSLVEFLCAINSYIRAKYSVCDSDMRDAQRTVIDLAEWQLHDARLYH